MKITVTILLCFFLAPLLAQSTHDVMIGGGIDLLKSDNQKLFDKAQAGLEVNYFIVRNFTVSAGAEFWTERVTSFAFGVRCYLGDHWFLRGRGLIGVNDFTLGIGYVNPITKNLRFEATADAYFRGDAAIRAGLAYVLR